MLDIIRLWEEEMRILESREEAHRLGDNFYILFTLSKEALYDVTEFFFDQKLHAEYFTKEYHGDNKEAQDIGVFIFSCWHEDKDILVRLIKHLLKLSSDRTDYMLQYSHSIEPKFGIVL